jgi:adenine-specific DNA-methyltransferase
MTDATKEQPESFDLNSDDVAARKRAELKRLFPEVFNEDKIDLDQLRRVMGDWVDEGSERFGLTWPGKAACMKVIQAPATGALRPDRTESVNFDESENVFIEGDNLEVLKLLQKSYFGEVKMIYIDPPYNKGKDFIYPDNYSESLDTYLRYTGQVDEKGLRLTTSTETSGRFHSRWLSMMMPRLYLAKNLLRDDGVIFISIDDNEQANLKKLCDYVFGEENFVGLLPTIMNLKGNHDNFGFSDTHEYTIVYAKIKEKCHLGHFDIDESDLGSGPIKSLALTAMV